MTVPAFCGEGTAMSATAATSSDDRLPVAAIAAVPLPDGNVLRTRRAHR
jgi:hypothetical protein